MNHRPITRNGVRFFEIPTGSRGSACRDCGILIYWIDVKGKRRPIDPNVQGGYSPAPLRDGQWSRPGWGALHFDVCSKRFKR